MKQTNNAIKFLMAQYRAIFKNANIAMVAAMVAAALAAGQAQAAAGDDGLNPQGKFETELKDSTIGSGDNLTHDASKWAVLSAPANKPISVENGGKLSLSYTGDSAKGHIYTGNDLVVNSGGSITLSGSDTAKAEIAGLVGVAKETAGVNTAVPTASLTINKDGKLDVTSSFAMMKDVNINGGTVNIGGSTGKNTVGDNAYLKYAAVYAEAGDLTVAGDAQVNLKAASHLYGQNVAINGGTINFEGTSAAGVGASGKDAGALLRAGDSKNGGTLTISNGKLNVAKGKSGDIVATTLNMKGGEINVSGTMGIGGNYHSNAPVADINVTGGKVTVANGGILNLDGNASFADATLANAGTVAVAIPTGAKRTLTVGEKAFTELLKGKLTATGVNAGAAETLNLVVEGDADLVTSGFLNSNGEINPNKAAFTDVDTSLTAKNVAIVAASYSGATAIKADSLVAGKEGAFAIKSGSTVDVAKGLTVTAKDAKADLTVNGTLNLDGTGSVIGANKVILASDSSSTPALNINNGTWSVKDLTLTSGTATVTGEGTTLDITGTLATKNANGILSIEKSALVDASEGVLTLEEATVKLTGGSTLVLDGNDVFKKNPDGSFAVVTAGGDIKSTFAQGAVTTDSTSVLSLKFTGDLSVTDLDAIKTAIDKSSGLKGFIKFEGANITGKPQADVAIGEIKPGIDGIYNDVAVTVGKNGEVDQNFTAGQIKLTDAADSKAAIANDMTVMLTGSKGDFVVKSGGEAADASLGSGSSLVLAGNGAIGAITASSSTAGQKGTLSIGHSSLGYGTVNAKSIDGGTAGLDVAVYGSTLNVAGKVAATDLTLEKGSTLNIKAEAGQGAVTAATLNLGAGSSINAAGQEISVSSNSEEAKIFGNVEAGSLSLAGNATIAGNADVDLGALKVATNKTLNVGRDGEDGSTASVFTDKLVMGKGATIFVDPSYNDHATVLATKTLTDGTAGDDVSVSNGNIKVGKNAAFGIGFDQAEFDSVMSNYLVDGKFTDPVNNQGYANAFVLNTSLKINSGTGVAVKHDLQDSDTVTGNSFTLGERAALIITDKAFGADKTGTAITFGDSDSSNAVATATVTADASSVISLVGDFDAKDTGLKIFAAVNGSNGAGTVTINGGNSGIKVQALGGLLVGNLGTNGSIDTLTLDPVAEKAIRSEVSAPVGQFFVDFANGKFDGATGAGYDFLVEALSYKQFKAVDAAAHAATYAGAQQAAVAAVTTMADAMFGRVGAVGVEAASISATGSQANGGVWLTPMYKSVDSDGFNAEGVSYGSDVDLAGVAFGTDTVNGNMRFGAVFNIGSGDAEGKGQGNGLKDEFDYYGFGIYSAMGFGNFALVGDASMTVISHDVEGFGLKGNADTTAVTMGVTGQYTFATPMVDVTPHLGARFIRLNTDSYDLTSADGVLATTDFDVQNVFSVPVGVTLSKAFVAGGWSLAPSADLTIAFNTGDTDAKSDTQFNSSKSMSVATNTEVLDEVTYGLTLGLGAQYGAFGTSFGINYTGSSNTDSLGVNAQARYMF